MKSKNTPRRLVQKGTKVSQIKNLFEKGEVSFQQLVEQEIVKEKDITIPPNDIPHTVVDIRTFFELEKTAESESVLRSEKACDLKIDLQTRNNKEPAKQRKRTRTVKVGKSLKGDYRGATQTNQQNKRKRPAIDGSLLNRSKDFLTQIEESDDSESVISGDLNYHTPDASFDVADETVFQLVAAELQLRSQDSIKPVVLKKLPKD